VEITEVRIKLMEEPGERLKAFCSITFDDCFVVRDLKIIEGANGPFVAMPSRKLTAHCGNCRSKNHLRAAYCNQCGTRLKETQTLRDEEGRAKLYADIAHPINTSCREMIQQRVVTAFEEEKVRAKLPGYMPSYDDFDQEVAQVDLRADGPSPPAGPSRLPRVQPQPSRIESQAARSKPPASRSEPPVSRSEPPVQPVEPQAPPVQPQVSQVEKPQGPHKAPAHVTQPSDRPKPGSFGAGIFE
jgi:stage V sporulation protein G